MTDQPPVRKSYVHRHGVPRIEGGGTLVEYHFSFGCERSESRMACIAADIREPR